MLIESDQLEAYIDGAIEKTMQDHNIAGMAISVVRSDGPVLVKGYGYANAPLGIAVDAERHPFHIGSVSKVITSTAVMKLASEGKIDLDADVGDYLPRRIFDDHLGSITVSDLLGHTTGMEEIYINFTGEVPGAEQLSDEDILARHRPAQIHSPGRASYTNHTWVLLGKVVEAVTGISYEQYVEQHILAPLGMRHSGFTPQTEAQRELFSQAKGQTWDGAQFRTLALDSQPQHHLLYPTGGLRSSASDMGRFMRMYLNMGRLDGVQILPEQTVMQSGRHLTQQAPETNGRTDTFWTYWIGRHRIYDHTGSVAGFGSRMMIIPSLDIAIFINFNTLKGAAIGLPGQIVKYLLADDLRPLSPRSDSGFDASRYTGRYMLSRRNETSLEKIILTQFARVSAGDDNRLEVNINGSVDLYYPVSEDLFQSAQTGDYLRFDGPDGGKAEIFSKGSRYLSFAHRSSYFHSLEFFLLLTIPGVAIALLQLFALLMQLAQRRRSELMATSTMAAWVLRVNALMLLLAALVLSQAFQPYVAKTELIYKVFPSAGLMIGFVLLHVVVFISPISGALVAMEWTKGLGDWQGRVARSLISLSYLMLSLGLILWNFVPDSLIS
ncbi:MAG: serine hydrolase domain-containing protein [Pseudomonadota bacterium]